MEVCKGNSDNCTTIMEVGTSKFVHIFKNIFYVSNKQYIMT